MKPLVALLVLLIAKFSSSQSISCVFEQQEGFPYTCNLNIQNPNGGDFDTVLGQHLPNRTDADVLALRGIGQNTANIPKIICFQFQNLVNFTLVNSRVRTLSEGSFAYCANVERIDLQRNELQEIANQSFYAAEHLHYLNLNTNRLTTLNLNSFFGTKIEFLDLNFNDFETFESAWLNTINETLTVFEMMTNSLTSLPEGVFGNLRTLRSLNIGVNFLTQLPDDTFRGLSNLEILFIHGNQLTELRPAWFNTLWSLRELRMEFNQVTSLPARIFANNHDLEDLGLSYNQIMSINRNAFGTLSNLRTFYGEINFINAIDPDFFEAATALNSMYLYDNICTRRNFVNIIDSRSEVRDSLQPCFDNFFIEALIHCTYLTSIGLPYTCELRLENPGVRDDFVTIEGDHLEGSSNSDVLRVEGYFQYSLNIPRIICAQFPALEELELVSSRIEFFTGSTLGNCTNLRILSLRNNNITFIPFLAFQNSPNLEILDLSNNHIETISSQSFTNTRLWYINLEQNDLWYFMPQWFTPVRETLLSLDIAANQITILNNLSFSELENLVELEMGFNPLSSLAEFVFSGLQNLRYLSLMSLNIDRLPPRLFADLVSLEMLHLERNNIQELPEGIFGNLQNLRDLYIYENNLTVIESSSFGSLSSLRTLNIQSNHVDAIEASFFENATSLYSIFMRGNLCSQQNFFNVQGSRDEVRRQLQSCFRNFLRLTGLIECNFIDVQPYGYFCELSIVNVFPRDFERIEGEHQQGRNDSDVFRVEAMEQETLNIPTIICETFNNLRELVFIESDVEVVTPEAISSCVNLELFSMEVNKIKVLPDGLFANAPNLQIANFYWNEISEIGENAFAETNIWAVELELNHISTFNPRWFESINSTLLYISLTENHLSTLPSEAFINLQNIVEIEFGYNPITSLPSNTFRGLNLLQDFGFDNCELLDVDPAWFADLPQLRRVHLQRNQLRTLPDNLHATNPHLFEFNVAGNHLQFLQADIFGNLTNLVYLYAYNNDIIAFDSRLFDDSWRLYHLNLLNNLCINQNFPSVITTRDQVRQQLQPCFDGFAREQTLNCAYSNDPIFNYACDMSVHNIRGFDDFANIGGQHLDGRGDSDVEFLMSYNQNSANIPTVICTQFPNLKQLYFARSRVSQLSAAAFDGCTLLEFVNLEVNHIRHLPAMLFSRNPNLDIANFVNNDISLIDGRAFEGTRLSQIGLSNNLLRTLERSWFEPVRSTLIYLNLGFNRLTTLPENIFTDLISLMEINLNGNRGIMLPSNAFRGLSNLTTLRIENCRLSELNSNLFADLHSVTRLYLQLNNITDIGFETFSGMRILNYLNLASNQIEVINSDWFGENLRTLTTFNAQNNQINAIDEVFFNDSTSLYTLQLANNLCASLNVINLPLNREQARTALSDCFENFHHVPADIDCEYYGSEIDSYTCYLTIISRHGRNNFEEIGGTHISNRGNPDVIKVETQNWWDNQIVNISPVFPSIICEQFPNLLYVFLMNCGIQRITPSTFDSCTSIVTIDLEGHFITEIPDGLFSNTPNVMYFIVNNNRIESVAPNAFAETKFRAISLSQNRLTTLDANIFQPVAESLSTLFLRDNNFSDFPAEIFRNLKALEGLSIGRNPFETLAANIFNDLVSLFGIEMDNTGLRELNAQWFRNSTFLEEIHMMNNLAIQELPVGMFNGLNALRYLNLDYNNLTTLNSNAFGSSLGSVIDIRARANFINAIDPTLIENATNLNSLYLLNNICTDMNFRDVQNNLEDVRGELSRCFYNFQ